MSSPSWRFPAGQELRWRTWDDEFLVYHTNSGDTHRLNAIGAAVLRSIGRGAVSIDTLVDRIAEELRLEPTGALRSEIVELLARLRGLGLAEPVDEPGPGPDGARDR